MGVNRQQLANSETTSADVVQPLGYGLLLRDDMGCTEITRLIYDIISESQEDDRVENLRLSLKAGEALLSGDVNKLRRVLLKFILEQLVGMSVEQFIDRYTTEEQRGAFLKKVCKFTLSPFQSVADVIDLTRRPIYFALQSAAKQGDLDMIKHFIERC